MIKFRRGADGKLILNKKAVSPVIAVLLMIAIAVAAAILVYVWSMGLIGTLQTGGGQQVREQIEMVAYDWSVNGTLVLHLKNVGASDVIVDNVYVEGVANPMSVSIPVRGSADATATNFGAATPGVAYTVKVVTQSGGVFSFSCIAGHAG